jgi:hypothetical protein
MRSDAELQRIGYAQPSTAVDVWHPYGEHHDRVVDGRLVSRTRSFVDTKLDAAIMSLVVMVRIFAFWSVDLSDAQVVGYLPSDVSGLSTIAHIFDGPDGLMLGLVFGFSVGIFLINPESSESLWVTLCWILLIGWGIDSEGFATIAESTLTTQPTTLSLSSLIFPLVGLGLSTIVIPTLVNIEQTNASQLTSAFCILIVFLDFSSSPVAWMLLGLLAHRITALRIHSNRGVATRHRWSGLLLTFTTSSVFIVIGLSWLALPQDPLNALWPSRFTIGWILLCGIIGALTPTMGYDAFPRPEAWGFHSGLILAPAILPNLVWVEHTQYPIFIIGIIVPILATLPEYHPQIDGKRRIFEGLLLVSVLPLSLYLTTFIPLSLLVIIATMPLLIRFEESGDEEE